MEPAVLLHCKSRVVFFVSSSGLFGYGFDILISRLLTLLQVVLTPPGGVGVPTTFYEFTTDRGVPYEEAMRIYNKEVGPRIGPCQAFGSWWSR